MSLEREPYCAIRLHISESTTLKTLGMKIRSIEVTFGNQDIKKLIKSKDDIADFEERTIVQELEKIWDDTTKMGHDKNWKFTEDYSE
jgi:hypothetical protein